MRNVANVEMLPIANANSNATANWQSETGTGNIGNNGNIPTPLRHPLAPPPARRVGGEEGKKHCYNYKWI